MHSIRSKFSHFLVPLVLAVLGAALCAFLVPSESHAVKQQLVGFPDSDVVSQQARPLILGALCFLPALAGLVYTFGSILDRYIIREFLGIFGVCLFALLMVWLLIDLSDKISDFRSSKHIWRTIALFYGIRSSAILLLLLPYSLLLSLLYSLGKLSTHREILAMVQAGRGVLRITLPLMIAGVFFSLLSMGLNYHWAPTAEATVTNVLQAAKGKPVTDADNVLYRNAQTHRLWMVGAFPQNYQNGNPLLDVEVTTTRDDYSLESRIWTKRALWNRNTRTWIFDNPTISRFHNDQPADYKMMTVPFMIKSWSETPWQLIKPGLSARYLGIPDLNAWINSNQKHAGTADASPYLTQWHYRWALPFTCWVTVLLATPLGIHFDRRGAGGGVFIAVVLSALMLLMGNISLALGESGTLGPAMAAWLPNIAFTLIGLYLFRCRISGVPIYRTIKRILLASD